MDEAGWVFSWAALIAASVIVVLLVAFLAARGALSYLERELEKERKRPSPQSWMTEILEARVALRRFGLVHGCYTLRWKWLLVAAYA